MAGFSDQSHMTRQFVKAYGIAPAQWLRMQASAATSFVLDQAIHETDNWTRRPR